MTYPILTIHPPGCNRPDTTSDERYMTEPREIPPPHPGYRAPYGYPQQPSAGQPQQWGPPPAGYPQAPQQWHPGYYPPPAPAQPWKNVTAYVALGLGVAGLFLFGMLLGPAAIVVGIVGWVRSSSHNGIGQKAAAGAILLGFLAGTLSVAGMSLLLRL